MGCVRPGLRSIKPVADAELALSSPLTFNHKSSSNLSHGSHTARSKTRIPLLLAKTVQPFSKLLHREGVVENHEAQHLLNKLASTLKVLSTHQQDFVSKLLKGKEDDLKFSYQPVACKS